MEPKPIIQVKHLTAQYGEDVILDNVSFDVFAGEIFVILGGSGCGKSTLLRHLIGLNRPRKGRILIDSIDISTCSDANFKKTLKKIGVLFQSGALIGSMTIGENVALPIREYTDLPDPLIEEIVAMKLCMVDLGGYASHLPSEISGGMKKRAGLARALALNPAFLFLDEPSAGLDPITSAEIDDLILHINHTIGMTMVIVTHELESIYKIAERVIMLDKSKKGIIAEGCPLELKRTSTDPLVKRFFHRQPMSSKEPTGK